MPRASQRLADAAEVISPTPAALQLRYLQTLTEVGVNQNSTIIFPLPLDVIRPFLEPGIAAATPVEKAQPAAPESTTGVEAPAGRDALPAPGPAGDAPNGRDALPAGAPGSLGVGSSRFSKPSPED